MTYINYAESFAQITSLSNIVAECSANSGRVGRCGVREELGHLMYLGFTSRWSRDPLGIPIKN